MYNKTIAAIAFISFNFDRNIFFIFIALYITLYLMNVKFLFLKIYKTFQYYVTVHTCPVTLCAFAPYIIMMPGSKALYQFLYCAFCTNHKQGL